MPAHQMPIKCPSNATIKRSVPTAAKNLNYPIDPQLIALDGSPLDFFKSGWCWLDFIVVLEGTNNHLPVRRP